MRCAWQELLHILPPWMRQDVDRQGSRTLQELRLRLNRKPDLRCSQGSLTLERVVEADDLNYIVNAASRYSPWSAATAAQGYLAVPGGHRIGLCGEAVVSASKLQGIRQIQSLCIRVARDFPGIAANLPRCGSVLIIGPPGAGKTTLLRDLIRQQSLENTVAAIDERGELFPPALDQDAGIDILTGCPKIEGIDILLRTMGPECIAVDEITSVGDCEALIQAAGCGVHLLATAHAASRHDLSKRPIYTKLLSCNIFDTLVILQQDKSWRTERM